MDFQMWIKALKAARAAAGMSQEQLAPMIKYSASLIAGVETARRRPTLDFARAADQALDTGGLLVELLEVANRDRAPSWFATWRMVEEQATRLHGFQPCLVPGILQTEDYARAIISAGGLNPPAEVEKLVAGRLERQELLTGERPKRYTGVIDELALRRYIGGRAVRRAQLEHLLTLTARPNISLHVMPADTGGYPGLTGGFSMATLPEGDVVVYLENAGTGQVLDQPEGVDNIQRKWEVILGMAMPESISVGIIEKLVEDL